ncbi:putative ankyrin repeat protein RF_0381 [Haliotis rufescens]|uniref:putative ankyrin repeat protein RF_0381 n=1 Tax=Haliotis rufescens TaxID=6454 RepID=UPI00201F2E3C|nr:putative ankyrin repeat protein RF_0381 [Haliotis rufescens]
MAFNYDVMESLTEAIRNNDVDRVGNLLDSGEITDIDEVYDVLTPLCEACHVNARDIALLLLSSGARVNAHSNSLGKQPLHFACDTPEDRMNLIECLLEAGCDINAQDEDGNTALHLACTQSNVEVTRLLLNSGADVTLEDVDGETALLRSCYAGFRMDEESFRMFSRAVEDCSKLSTEERKRFVSLVTQWRLLPLDLKELCRVKLRQLLPANVDKCVQQLHPDLPRSLVRYLQYDDVVPPLLFDFE